MSLIIDTLKFCVFSVFVFYIPGKYLISWVKADLDSIQNISASFVSGILFFCLVSILRGLIGVNFFAVFAAFIIFDLWTVVHKKVQLKFEARPELLLLIFASIVFAILAGINLFKSGISTHDGLVMAVGIHDPLQHLAIIGQLQNNFPPKNPFFSGVALSNYHYFADILIAGVLDAVHIDRFNFYFRIFPFFNAVLFAFSCYSLMAALTKKIIIRVFGLLLCAFGGTFAYLLIFLLPNVRWSGVTFWVDQPFAQLFNPQTYLGYSLFFVGSMFLIFSTKAKGISTLLTAGLLLGFIFPFKVFGAVICVGSMFGLAIYMAVFFRNYKYFIPFIISASVFLILSITTVSSYRNGLYFAPGWSLSVLVESPDRLNLVDWSLKLQYYKQDHNLLRIIQIYGQEIFIFVFGNLGVRTIGAIFLLFLLLKNVFRVQAEHLFFFFCIVISFLIPLIFNQGSSPYDIFQFVPFGLLTASIFSALFLENLLKRFNGANIAIILFGLLVLLFSIPTTLLDIHDHIANDFYVVDQKNIDAFNFIANNSSKNDVVLVYPDKENLNAAYVGAFSRRISYVSDIGSTNITAVDGRGRANTALEFFNNFANDQRVKFLEENNIAFILLPTIGTGDFNPKKANLPLEKVFENEKSIVYRRN